MKVLHTIAFILVIVGAINWGLVGVGGEGWNVVNLILGSVAWLERLVYIIVGLSGILLAFTHKGCCRMCDKQAPAQTV